MSKKTSLLFGLAAGIAAYTVTKKVLKEHRPEIKAKLQELKDNGTEVGLRYYDYAKDYLNNQVDVKTSFADLKERVLDAADSLKNNDKLQQAFTSLKDATDELKEELANQHQEQEELDGENDDEIVIDGRSAFGEAKAAADFEEDHPTETFFPHGE
ncbi:hypothetical protein [Liquorilactobacillus sicerae]|uniref:hypothetical protein n=1 Tax=Liquorilactobacillus sicerae TaxID=1416943 RepID=UPI0024802C2E|nr:hypothetical protein [Liquorilactobacillus sicerae]